MQALSLILAEFETARVQDVSIKSHSRNYNVYIGDRHCTSATLGYFMDTVYTMVLENDMICIF